MPLLAHFLALSVMTQRSQDDAVLALRSAQAAESVIDRFIDLLGAASPEFVAAKKQLSLNVSLAKNRLLSRDFLRTKDLEFTEEPETTRATFSRLLLPLGALGQEVALVSGDLFKSAVAPGLGSLGIFDSTCNALDSAVVRVERLSCSPNEPKLRFLARYFRLCNSLVGFSKLSHARDLIAAANLNRNGLNESFTAYLARLTMLSSAVASLVSEAQAHFAFSELLFAQADSHGRRREGRKDTAIFTKARIFLLSRLRYLGNQSADWINWARSQADLEDRRRELHLMKAGLLGFVTRFAEVSAFAREVLDNNLLNERMIEEASLFNEKYSTTSCSICLEDFGRGDFVSSAPSSCGHLMHTKCLVEWTKKSPSCPMCRGRFIAT